VGILCFSEYIGAFRSEEGVPPLNSIISTIKKQKQEMLAALAKLMEGKALGLFATSRKKGYFQRGNRLLCVAFSPVSW
jgi:hypothetical protein